MLASPPVILAHPSITITVISSYIGKTLFWLVIVTTTHPPETHLSALDSPCKVVRGAMGAVANLVLLPSCGAPAKAPS